MSRWAFASAFALSLAVSASAFADNVEQAKMLFSAGAAAYEKQDFQGAIRGFEAAEKLAPRPAILFSLAQAHRRQYYVDSKPEHLRAAVEMFRDYVKSPQATRQADAAQALQELGPAYDRLGGGGGGASGLSAPQVSINSSGTPNARISLDGAPAVGAPLIGPVAAGKHRVVISAEGFVDETREVAAAPGSMVAVDVPLKEKPAIVSIVARSGARVEVDGRPMGETPLSAPLEVTSGPHLLAVLQNGHEAFAREIELARGEKRAVDASTPSSRQRKLAVMAFVGSAVAIVGGGAFLTVALVQEARAQSILGQTTSQAITQSDLTRYDAARIARDNWTIASLASFGTGGLLALVGTALFVFDMPSASGAAMREQRQPKPEHKVEPTEVSLAPLISPGLIGATAAVRF